MKESKRYDGITDTQSVYEELTGRTGDIIVVGPSRGIEYDAGLLFLAARAQGRVLIADPMYGKWWVPQESLNGMVGQTGGYGDVPRYLEQISQLRQAGLRRIADPEWLGSESGFWRIPVAEASADTIIDHATSQFIASNLLEIERQKTESGFIDPDTMTSEIGDTLIRGYREYFRVLRSGGKALVFVNRTGYQTGYGGKSPPLPVDTASVLQQAGFSVTRMRIADDSLHIALTDSDAAALGGRLSGVSRYSRDTEEISHIIARGGYMADAGQAGGLIFPNPWCRCDELIVASKP